MVRLLRRRHGVSLTLIVGVKGEAWIVPDDGTPVRITPGDVAVTRAPDHYNVADAPGTPPNVIIHPGQRCCDLAGNSVLEKMTRGVRTWNNDPAGSTVFVVGAYEQPSDISDRLLRALPPILSLSKAAWDSPLIHLLLDEVVKDEPGQAAVLDRLLDLLLTAVLKAWFAQHGRDRPAWWQFQGDRMVGRALRIMHDNPAHPWTVVKLASELGVSRASLARKFHERVGEPPMTFLKTRSVDIMRDQDLPKSRYFITELHSKRFREICRRFCLGQRVGTEGLC